MRNNVSSVQNVGTDENWRGFDALPLELKQVLWGAARQWCPKQMHRRYARQVKNNPRQVVIDRLTSGLAREEAAEIRQFAAEWPPEFGQYPHLEAGVSVQRYGRTPEP